ncbi:MAG TPA: hypothetical protein VGQ09_16650 [Chitinophagaceae bacterium]|jgi:hypothetical protein|nr:hypothetical protein [Chitinophagaceae bacterium]
MLFEGISNKINRIERKIDELAIMLNSLARDTQNNLEILDRNFNAKLEAIKEELMKEIERITRKVDL